MAGTSKKDEMKKRQEEILQILRDDPKVTQEDLQKKMGFSQATMSRELKRLGWIKDGNSWVASEKKQQEEDEERLYKALLEYGQAAFSEVGLFALRTTPGYARSTALLLQKAYSEVVGSIAGEDLAIVVTSDKESAKALAEKVGTILGKTE